MDKLKLLNLLYIESDKSLNFNSKELFEALFKNLKYINNLEEAKEYYEKKNTDIVIMDDKSIKLVEHIRKQDLNTPIIIVSDTKDVDTLFSFINLQINGYLLNPINLDDLSYCFNNCIKKIEVNEMFTIDENISYDLTNKELFVLEKPLKLGKKLNKLLYFFITNKNKVLSKDDIQYKVWDDDSVSDSSIKNLIGSLRQIVGKGKIVNLPGIGWKFVI